MIENIVTLWTEILVCGTLIMAVGFIIADACEKASFHVWMLNREN